MLDRGFIFGDGIYEVVPVYGRKLFRFDEHMARLARNLAKVRITNPFTRDAMARAHSPAGGMRWPSSKGRTTSSSTSRSRAAWRRATM